ncbi:histone deacetylase 15 [Olea europaea subsp. europaea]|uniref:histone deacetylase n=1 Tax=Olea europaea subsp. europaea TaxID=158383 RepID=A0A8S0QXQ2_OLEEU|nr:histone deacetylase 15 [Olea europaea subsp. europaea]
MTRLNNGDAENHLQNGDSEPNSNAEDATKSAKAKRKNDMTLEDMYNTPYDFDEDEDEDSDWEPFENHHVVEIAKWFCVNCTIFNLDNFDHCNVCGEHRNSGILKHGYFASPFSQEECLLQNETEIAERDKGSCLQTIASDKSTAIGFDERMLLHEEVEMKSHPHPERPDRLRAIVASLETAGIYPGRCFPILAREIKREELQMVHSLENIEAVELTSNILSCYFTPDTYANQYSARAARLAAGLCADLASAIYSRSAKNGFALVRPPGHHAGVKQSMGFCLHNNAAIAACAAQVAGAKKVLIIDWDVHHGNGTQEIFEKNKSVLYISLHRHEGGKFYPGTGAANQVGTNGAEGYCVNVPWSRGGVGDNDYMFAFQHAVLPIASEFAPDFTIISAGFDAARGDPLGCCDVTPAGYAQMTQMCSALSGGKLLVILEGGFAANFCSSILDNFKYPFSIKILILCLFIKFLSSADTIFVQYHPLPLQ